MVRKYVSWKKRGLEDCFSGHTLQDMFALRHGKLERIPDIVVWPSKDLHSSFEGVNMEALYRTSQRSRASYNGRK